MLALVIWTIRAFYLLSSFAILTVGRVPALADSFLAYGARSEQEVNEDNEKSAKQNRPLVGIKLLDCLATFTVPHTWFKHFYVFSLSCSLVLCSMFYYLDYVEAAVLQGQNLDIAVFCSLLMLLQGSRRLLECIYVTRPGSSRMWIGHYAIGLAFYFVTNIAVWVDHVKPTGNFRQQRAADANTEQQSILWTWRTLLCTLIFFAASDKQNQYHRYLCSLEKYTLPKKHAFQYVIAPHYTLECLIYLSLAILDAPYHKHKSSTINWTLFCALIFVAVNLGVTADGTKTWQRIKFKDEGYEIMKSWRMVPFVY